MSTSDILYVKGMNMDGSEVDTDEDIWDDKKLNEAYDKALKMANEEVAQRVAMATNSKDKSGETSETSHAKKNVQPKQTKLTKQQKKMQAQKDKPKHQWKEGMPCRAMYQEDGCQYEGIVLTILDDKECVIRFIGYNNTEIVSISSLQPSLGKEARRRQAEEATLAKEDDECASPSIDNDFSDLGTFGAGIRNGGALGPGPQDGGCGGPGIRMPPRSGFAGPRRNRFRMPKRRLPGRLCPMEGFPLDDMPLPEVSISGHRCPMDMPIPPPPLVGFGCERPCPDSEGLGSMLLSWYMSGYHTGYYLGLKEGRSHRCD